MVTIDTLTAFLGWASLINVIVLAATTIALIAMREVITRTHARMFGLDEGDLARAYFQYLAQYKIAILVLNVVPYLALRIVT